MRKAILLGSMMFAAGVSAVSTARASDREREWRLDECTVTCALGGCHGSSWAFWKDCICSCLPNGHSSCSCF
jgi:hypothetical protein